MSWYTVHLDTRAGKIRFAEAVLTIGEKLLTNSFVLLFGAGVANAIAATSSTVFWTLYAVVGIGLATGVALLFVGADQFDKAHQIASD